ncbi:MAG: histidine kinase [Spirochaetales bacterium]|uniref:Histidine kinase n=1 Tax=Candidatus Thalassospirochaeta sargassi TaxID=3119039 RepID=A0AAJ1IB83_9SPIO|nr:histidine kinase [Spirochaetales bacterium]
MKIQNRLNLMSTVLLLIFTIASMCSGVLVINDVVFQLNTQLLELRLDGILKEINGVYEILERTGLNNIPKYNESAQQELLQRFRKLPFGKSGQIIIIDNNRVDLITEVFELDFIKQMQIQKSGTIKYDYFDEQRFGIFDYFPEWNWVVALSITEEEIYSSRTKYIFTVSIVTFFTALFSVTVALFFSRQLTRSIQDILRGLKKVEGGDLSIRFKPRTNIEELIILKNGINSMISNISKQTAEIVASNQKQLNMQHSLHQSELHHKEARILALQSQINPHFLYNTLECINSIATIYEVKEIQLIAISLSKMFKYAIKGDIKVSIKEELDSVNDYLNIQKIRFVDKINTIIDIPEPVMKFRIMKFIMQPLVENAIYHGIEPKIGKGTIKIYSITEDEILNLIIEDDGLGIEEEELYELNQFLSMSATAVTVDSINKRSIGLININNRIKLSYGPEYGLRIKNLESCGVAVIVKTPILQEE